LGVVSGSKVDVVNFVGKFSIIFHNIREKREKN